MKNTHAQEWLDQNEYPFENRYIDLKQGKMHYIDEGSGDVILFIHGTPTWSFLYRNYIKSLSQTYRCIAIDHLGFGLSDKPLDFNGTPEEHSRNLTEFVDKLNLNNITLVVHDFGGPIGLGFANENPSKIKRVAMFNTWLWATKSDPEAQKIDRIINSGIGRFLYLNLNFSPRFLLKTAFHNKKRLTKSIHRQYIKPYPNKDSRWGLYKIGQSLVGSSDWYEQQWEKLNNLKSKPWLIIWGTKDEFIKPEYLELWEERLPDAEINKIECGHFVQEEAFDQSIEMIKTFFNQTDEQPIHN